MDAITQAEGMIRSWAEVQQKMWSRWQELWLESLKGVEGSAGDKSAQAATEQARRVLEAWDQSVKRALDAQLEWTRIWTERVAESGNVPPQLVAAARQLHQSAKAWTDLQTKLWEGWLDMAGGSNLGGVEAFQQTAQTLAEAQTEWLGQWAGMAREQAPKGRERRTKKSGG